MAFPELSFRWEWRLRSAPERLWPYVADTNRFNHDTGLPAVTRVAEESRVTARRRLRFRRFGVPFEWEEEPFEWEEPRRFGVNRRYRVGPLETLRVQVELVPLPDGGTRLVYTTRVRPRSLFGLLSAPFALGIVSRRSFGAAFRRYDALARETRPPPPSGPPRLAPGGRARLATIADQLARQFDRPELVARLVAEVERGDELTLAHLRPYALADTWGVPRRPVLILCLWATRAGLFDLQWDLLCPLCRGAKLSTSTLAELTGGVHCPTCNIDLSTNLERSVELTFRPNPAIRPIDAGDFCVAGPRTTPHVVAQQLLPAGAQRVVHPRLQPGRYRLRTLGQPGGRYLLARSGGAPKVEVVASDAGWPADEPEISPEPTLRLENRAEGERLFLLERLEWTDQAVTAAEVATLQVFRDLFSTELVRPGEWIAVGSLTILFTDLRDSTALYRRIGDAPAFGRVLDHFAVLREEVTREDGAIVKTIGDAIMAVFRRPRPALDAILRAQTRLAHPPEGGLPLHLKAGLHHGPCIAVTLNERLDYFGSAVNLASRLERFSSGADVVVSAPVHDDPEVAELLADMAAGLHAQAFDAPIRGFEEESFPLWRVGQGDGAM